jgi:drug/metabolite transporter (DMT)-like permease
MGSIMFGGLNKVGFREDGVYSYSSFSNPGSPFVHQMLVHRAMMSFLSLVCAIYSVISLPENVSLIILMLFPFFVGLAAFTFEKERLSIT